MGIAPRLKTGSPIVPYVLGVAMQPPDHYPVQTGCLSLQSHQVTDAGFIQPPVVVDYQHVARCCHFECLQEGIDAASVPGRTDTPGQAAAGHHSTQQRRSATHWDSGADTGVGHVGCGEGCKPVLQRSVVHDDVPP